MAAMASDAAARCGRVREATAMTPMMRPNAPATTMSSQPVRSNPATAAEGWRYKVQLDAIWATEDQLQLVMGVFQSGPSALPPPPGYR